MARDEQIGEVWRAHRSYLVDMAFRMLGDIAAAEDMVQEAFVRLLQTELDDIKDLRGWLIVVTGRLCLDHMRSAKSRRERPADMAISGYVDRAPTPVDPADRVTLDDEVRLALLIVLQRLTPAERVVFVLHDVFQMPFAVVAETVGRPTAACRQLAHRARLKVQQSAKAGLDTVDPIQHQAVTSKFIAACSHGDLDELLTVLDPNVSGEMDTRTGIVAVGAQRVGRNLLRFWGGPDILFVSMRFRGQPALLAFAERELAGVLTLAIDNDRITKVHVFVHPSVLDPLRAQLTGSR